MALWDGLNRRQVRRQWGGGRAFGGEEQGPSNRLTNVPLTTTPKKGGGSINFFEYSMDGTFVAPIDASTGGSEEEGAHKSGTERGSTSRICGRDESKCGHS